MNNLTEISRRSCSDDSVLKENAGSRLCIRPNCTEDSEETKTVSSNIVGQSNCSETPLLSNDTSTRQSSLQRHYISLKQQMARQKAEYEAMITSLEQRNKELHLEIKDLHSKLGQQQKWYRLVEIKMCNAERAWEDAERRNATLQKEMEQFFDTFGELTNEIKCEMNSE